jgi:hypothetical protein
MVSLVKARSRKKGYDFNLTQGWALERLVYGRCEVTGIRFSYKHVGWNRFKPSIDRKDSSRGYTQQNCQMVILQYNIGKGCWSDAEYARMCSAAVKNRKVAKFSVPEKQLILKSGRKVIPKPQRFVMRDISMRNGSKKKTASNPIAPAIPTPSDMKTHEELYS